MSKFKVHDDITLNDHNLIMFIYITKFRRHQNPKINLSDINTQSLKSDLDEIISNASEMLNKIGIDDTIEISTVNVIKIIHINNHKRTRERIMLLGEMKINKERSRALKW